MAADDSRALARPARTLGLNLRGCFNGEKKKFREAHRLRKTRPGTSARPHREGKSSERSMLIFDNTAYKPASPSNFRTGFSHYRCAPSVLASL
jgi:hypothetical protein